MCLKRSVCLKCGFRGSGQVEMMSLGLSPVTRNAEQWEISEQRKSQRLGLLLCVLSLACSGKNVPGLCQLHDWEEHTPGLCSLAS